MTIKKRIKVNRDELKKALIDCGKTQTEFRNHIGISGACLQKWFADGFPDDNNYVDDDNNEVSAVDILCDFIKKDRDSSIFISCN